MKNYNHNDIKEWYQATYPTDELGNELYDGITWVDLWNHILDGYDVYGFIGVDDSIVRERIFGELADILGVDYNVVYYAWMDDFKKALKSLIK